MREMREMRDEREIGERDTPEIERVTERERERERMGEMRER